MKDRPVFMLDDDREKVSAGDSVRFNYGIPPVLVIGKVEQRGRRLFVLTPGHNPAEANLRSLRRFVGNWFKHEATPSATVSPPSRVRAR